MKPNLVPYQWSIKLEDGQIFCIQTETCDELVLAKEEVIAKFGLKDITDELPETPTSGLICGICKSKAEIREGVSKTGNSYKIFKCSKFPETKNRGGHSLFMKP